MRGNVYYPQNKLKSALYSHNEGVSRLGLWMNSNYDNFMWMALPLCHIRTNDPQNYLDWAARLQRNRQQAKDFNQMKNFQ